VGYHPDEAGRIIVTSLRAGQPLRLRISDPLGTFLHEEELPPMRPEEDRKVEVTIRQVVHDFRGIVVNEEGKPLAGAKVW
jgi:hypothetical protein